jgi:hypothetical protein
MLAQDLETMLPDLVRILAGAERGAYRVDWLSHEGQLRR